MLARCIYGADAMDSFSIQICLLRKASSRNGTVQLEHPSRTGNWELSRLVLYSSTVFPTVVQIEPMLIRRLSIIP